MAQSFSIPDINLISRSEYGKTNIAAWEQWKTYFESQDQNLIRILTTEQGITDAINRFDFIQGNPKNFFVVIFPKSIHHLNDFKNGASNAEAYAFFNKNGKSKIFFFGEEEPDVQLFYDAWSEIFLRVTGKKAFYPVSGVPKESLILTQEILSKKEQYEKNLQEWRKLFVALDVTGDNVHDYDGNGDGVIEFDVLRVRPGNDNYSIALFRLDGDGNCEDYYWDGEDAGPIYEKWRETADRSSWEGFYKSLLELSRLYAEVPEVPKFE